MYTCPAPLTVPTFRPFSPTKMNGEPETVAVDHPKPPKSASSAGGWNVWRVQPVTPVALVPVAR